MAVSRVPWGEVGVTRAGAGVAVGGEHEGRARLRIAMKRGK